MQKSGGGGGGGGGTLACACHAELVEDMCDLDM